MNYVVLRKEGRSEFYGTLAWMGLLSTEEYRIRTTRMRDADDVYVRLDLTRKDIDRIGYLYPHVEIDPRYDSKFELWIEDRYLNPKMLEWITGTYRDYAILDQDYDETIPVMCYHNPNIVYRFNALSDSDETLTHTVMLDLTEAPYCNIQNIEHCAYYISENKYHIPDAVRNGNTVTFTAPYQHDIDFFLCSNLVNVLKADAGKGIYLDQLYSNNSYHRIIIDHDPAYPIDARFYPCISVDKDCIIRVYNDRYHQLLFPEVSRLLAYPEFLDVVDPYNTDNEYLNNLAPVDELILSSDGDDVVVEKFSKIAAYCYRMWERFPHDTSEVSNFIICDNSQFGHPIFTKQTVYLMNEEKEAIVASVPYEEYRDIIFYDGMVFSDYTIRRLKYVDSKLIESPTGNLSYLFDTSLSPDKFTLIKFNTDRDTNFINIGEYINEENIARLHIKLNRFYRNLLIVRTELLDSGDYARIATVQPNATDDYLWFELLTNTIPEMFETNPIEQINLYGLDPNKIPDDVANGAYMLEAEPNEEGPNSYQDILITYFKLAKNRKEYLALQVGDGVDDPRVQELDEFSVGNPADIDKPNAIVIDDPETHPTATKRKYEEGFPEVPYTEPHSSGDLYFKNKDEGTPPPGEENTEIDEISMGPQEPEGNDNRLWIDTHGEHLPGLITGDMYDSETDHITITNNADALDADMGDYVLESPSVTDDEEITIDDLLEGLTKPDTVLGIPEGQLALEPIRGNYDPEKVDAKISELIQTIDADNAENTTLDLIKQMSGGEKLDIVHRLITQDQEPEDANEGDLWIEYLTHTPAGVLNLVVYKVLLAAHVYNIKNAKYGDLAIEGEGLPESINSVIVGDYPRWTKENQLFLQKHPIDAESGYALPEWYAVREHNFKCIMSYYEPDDPQNGDLWINIPAAVLGEIIKDVISSTLFEIGEKLPEGYYDDSGYDTLATVAFDYHPHDKGTEGLGELFRERIDESLHPIHYGKVVDESKLKEDDIWYEFLDDISGIVAYSDQTSMILRINERLIMVEFDDDNITAFAFDDVFMNFRGTLGIRYLSIVADLIRSGELSLNDINIFYKRLITHEDVFDPGLQRLYTGTSFVVSTLDVEASDYAILYSSNIGRFRMDYSNPETTNRERGHAYRMCIDLTRRDFTFIYGKMLLFVNGKYIRLTDYTETAPGYLQLKDFHEIIAMVDIFYDKKDINLMSLKGCVSQYIPNQDDCVSIQRPSGYATMEPIKLYDQTKRGFYDVLLHEYILNGKLLRILHYLDDHPEEYEDYRRELIQRFHAISDTDLWGQDDRHARIVLSGDSPTKSYYEIKEGGE